MAWVLAASSLPPCGTTGQQAQWCIRLNRWGRLRFRTHSSLGSCAGNQDVTRIPLGLPPSNRTLGLACPAQPPPPAWLSSAPCPHTAHPGILVMSLEERVQVGHLSPGEFQLPWKLLLLLLSSFHSLRACSGVWRWENNEDPHKARTVELGNPWVIEPSNLVSGG